MVNGEHPKTDKQGECISHSAYFKILYINILIHYYNLYYFYYTIIHHNFAE